MVEEISTKELEKRVGQTDGGFIPGALHVPMSRLPAEMDEHEWGDEIYIICRHGNSSVQAARLLMSYEGVDPDAVVASVAGGYLDWEGELSYDEEATKKAAAA
jgi:rhodanese-related sulfurtransferase